MTHSTSEGWRHWSAARCCHQPLCAGLQAASQAQKSRVPAARLVRNRCVQVVGVQREQAEVQRANSTTPQCQLYSDHIPCKLAVASSRAPTTLRSEALTYTV